MATQHRHRLVWLGVFACACAADEDPQSLERYAVEMQLTIDAMHTALAAHHESMHALSDLDAVDILGLEPITRTTETIPLAWVLIPEGETWLDSPIGESWIEEEA